MKLQEWLPTQLQQDIWRQKYQFNNETLQEFISRVAGGNPTIARLIWEKKLLPGGRILANRGTASGDRKVTYSNCYVIAAPEDNLESIFDRAKELARTYSYGGGVGMDLSKLSPRGAKIRNAAKQSSGAVSFMELYNLVTGLISQEGRRGALMLSMSIDHPDVEEFIDIKNDLGKINKANISVRLTDRFMEAVEAETDYEVTFTRPETGEEITRKVDARKLFEKIARNNWEMAEPGALFWDRVKNWSLLSNHPEFKFGGVNPCVTGDTLIQTVEGEIPIKDLVGKTPYVYTVDSDGNLTIKQAVKVWKTKDNAELVKVITGRGELICTPDHLVMLSNGEYRKARELKTGDKIKGLNRSMDVKAVQKLEHTESVYDMIVPETHNFIANGFTVHNCGEEPLPDYGSCLLVSINLSEFVKNPFTRRAEIDIEGLELAVEAAVIYANEILDEGLPLHPLKQQRESVRDWRQIGVGIMGLADMLIKMGQVYGSEASIDTARIVGETMINTAVRTSAMLAAQNGAFPKYSPEIMESEFFKQNIRPEVKALVEKYGLRNSQLLTIAPTGSISTMLGVSGGCEPHFAIKYRRKTESLHGEDKFYTVYAPIAEAYIEKTGVDLLPPEFVTAMEIPYENRIKMQAALQQYIDASISSTVNLPEETTVKQVADLYLYAWKKGVKGITIYRAGCKREGILTTGETKSETTELQRGEIKKAPDVSNECKTERLNTGCGPIYVTMTKDNDGINQIFVARGSKGTCQANQTAVSRLISLALRGGISVEAVIDQLLSVPVCPSYYGAKCRGNDVAKGSSCPSAIAHALKAYAKQEAEIKQEPVRKVAAKPEVKELENTGNPCPTCGEPLAMQEGCQSCVSCGFSRCGV